MKHTKTALGLAEVLGMVLHPYCSAAGEDPSLLFAVSPNNITCTKGGAYTLSIPTASRTIWFSDWP